MIFIIVADLLVLGIWFILLQLILSLMLWYRSDHIFQRLLLLGWLMFRKLALSLKLRVFASTICRKHIILVLLWGFAKPIFKLQDIVILRLFWDYLIMVPYIRRTLILWHPFNSVFSFFGLLMCTVKGIGMLSAVLWGYRLKRLKVDEFIDMTRLRWALRSNFYCTCGYTHAWGRLMTVSLFFSSGITSFNPITRRKEFSTSCPQWLLSAHNMILVVNDIGLCAVTIIVTICIKDSWFSSLYFFSSGSLSSLKVLDFPRTASIFLLSFVSCNNLVAFAFKAAWIIVVRNCYKTVLQIWMSWRVKAVS